MTSDAYAPRVLYVVYWGTREPLGQSQLLPWIRRLASRGVRLTLVTFEKPADMQDARAVAATRAGLESYHVRWIPLRYHKRPRMPATFFDVVQGSVRCILERLKGPYDVIHARTFIGGLIGRAVAPVIGARLVFHGEGFYPDELVDGGVFRENSLPHRIGKALESYMYSRADAIIAMSYRGKAIIERMPGVADRKTPVIVAPACPDPELFPAIALSGNASAGADDPGSMPGASMAGGKRDGADDVLRLVYVGSIGYRYRLDAIGRLLAVAARMGGPVQLRIITPGAFAEVAGTLDAAGAPRSLWSVETLPHRAVPAELERQDAGLVFLNIGLSAAGGSSTKVGEYWAAGLPVVASPNVADTDSVIRNERVGVVVQGDRDEDYARAIGELHELLRDPGIRARCRRAAARHFAIDPACDRQVALYRLFCGGRQAAALRQPS